MYLVNFGKEDDDEIKAKLSRADDGLLVQVLQGVNADSVY